MKIIIHMIIITTLLYDGREFVRPRCHSYLTNVYSFIFCTVLKAEIWYNFLSSVVWPSTFRMK